MVRFQTEGKAGHGTVRFVRQLQHRVAELQIGDLKSAGGSMLEVFFESKMLFIECHGAIKITDVNGDMVDTLEHGLLLQPREHRPLRRRFASSRSEVKKRWWEGKISPFHAHLSSD